MPTAVKMPLTFSLAAGTSEYSVPAVQVIIVNSKAMSKSIYRVPGRLTQMNHSTEENMKMTDCYFEKKDWRQCKDEASCHPSINTYITGEIIC